MDSIASCAWPLREAILRAARSDEALPTAPDRARTTHVAGVSRSRSKSELLLRFPTFFIHPPGGTPVRRAHISLGNTVAHTRFIAKIKPRISDIGDRFAS